MDNSTITKWITTHVPAMGGAQTVLDKPTKIFPLSCEPDSIVYLPPGTSLLMWPSVTAGPKGLLCFATESQRDHVLGMVRETLAT